MSTIISETSKPISYIICRCGKHYLYSQRFSVYESDFCSSKCLQEYRAVEDNIRNPKVSDMVVQPRPDYGGSMS